MDRTACTEPQCLYNGALYRYLYLYSPYGPYGLYRASVPVQRCTLTFILHYKLQYFEAGAGRDSSDGIATGYGLDGPGIESQWERDFLHLTRPALGPTQPPIQCVPGLSQESSDRGVALTTHHI